MTTPTTTTTSTTTRAASSQTPCTDSKFTLYLAIAIGCVAVILLLFLIIILVKMFCCKKPLPRTEKPIITIEGTSHRTSGYGVVPLGRTEKPRETMIVEDMDQESEGKASWEIDNEQKRSYFPKEQINEQNVAFQSKPSVNVPPMREGQKFDSMQSKETQARDITPPLNTESMYVARPALPSENTKTVPVFDDIIMDENVNFALRYSSRMQHVMNEWHEQNDSGSSPLNRENSNINVVS